MTSEIRHILFDWSIRLNKTTYAIFGKEIGVSRQAISQALRNNKSSKPIIAKIDEYILQNMPRIRDLSRAKG